MRIAVVGAGALGGYYGALLVRAGFDVHFLMRRDYKAVRQKGLMVHSCNGDFYLPKVNCYRRVEDIPPVDLVFVGLKTTANDFYQQLLTPLMGAETRVLTAQNGLGNDERLAELFGPERVAGGLAFLCSNRLEPGVINHLDYGHIHIGNFGRGPDEKLQRFGEMLRQSYVKCEVVDNLALAQWRKLVWNVPFNGLSALLDKTVDCIMADDELCVCVERLMKEVQAAAQSHGLVIEDESLVKMMDYSAKMKPYYTSMQLDRHQRQPMEIESIIGEPLRRGQGLGLDLPGMQRLYSDLTKLDCQNRK